MCICAAGKRKLNERKRQKQRLFFIVYSGIRRTTHFSSYSFSVSFEFWNICLTFVTFNNTSKCNGNRNENEWRRCQQINSRTTSWNRTATRKHWNKRNNKQSLKIFRRSNLLVSIFWNSDRIECENRRKKKKQKKFVSSGSSDSWNQLIVVSFVSAKVTNFLIFFSLHCFVHSSSSRVGKKYRQREKKTHKKKPREEKSYIIIYLLCFGFLLFIFICFSFVVIVDECACHCFIRIDFIRPRKKKCKADTNRNGMSFYSSLYCDLSESSYRR